MLLDEDAGMSEVLKRKDREKAAKAQSRQRVRGGAPNAAGRDGTPKDEPKEVNLTGIQGEAEHFERL
jgi:hypothetical protein